MLGATCSRGEVWALGCSPACRGHLPASLLQGFSHFLVPGSDSVWNNGLWAGPRPWWEPPRGH